MTVSHPCATRSHDVPPPWQHNGSLSRTQRGLCHVEPWLQRALVRRQVRLLRRHRVLDCLRELNLPVRSARDRAGPVLMTTEGRPPLLFSHSHRGSRSRRWSSRRARWWLGSSDIEAGNQLVAGRQSEPTTDPPPPRPTCLVPARGKKTARASRICPAGRRPFAGPPFSSFYL